MTPFFEFQSILSDRHRPTAQVFLAKLLPRRNLGAPQKKQALTHPPFTQPMTPPNTAPIFIGGAGRSGTTLLRVILDSHPHIACGPELKVTPLVCRMWEDFQAQYLPTLREHHLTRRDLQRIFSQMLAALLENYRTRSGKPRVAEKSPNNVFVFPHLHHLFPKSPLIHVVRDGRDVVASLLRMDWISPKTGQPLDYTRDVRKAAEYWRRAVAAGRAAQRQIPSLAGRYFELRYEQIVTDPAAALQPLFAFLGEPWDPAVLKFHEQERRLAGDSSAAQVTKALNTKALGRWKKDLKRKEKDAVKEVAGDLLIELGYAADHAW